MDNTESKDLLDMDDFEMDELLTEFAEEENKTDVVELSDSEDELGKLVEEFATTLSDSEDDEKGTGAKIILSSSDDEIDNLLDGFNEEDSSESESVQVKQEMDLSKPVQMKQEVLSEKDIDCGTYDENKKSIIIIDSNTQNDTFYDSAVEILVSDENTGTPVKASLPSNLCNFKTNESQPAFSLSAININDYSQKQEHEKHTQDIPRKTNSADSTRNCSEENTGTYIQQSNENFERNNQNKNFKDEFSSVPCNDSNDISHTNNSYVPVKTLPTNENLDSLVNSVIELNNLKKNPSPLSIANVTILCDENVLKPKNENTKDVSMTKIIERAIDECMKQNLKTSSIKAIEQESTNLNANIESSEFQENSSETLPVIENVTGSECNTQRRLENSISNCDSAQQKSCKNTSEDEANSTSEDSANIKSNTFSLANLSIKSENMVKPSDSKNCLKNLLVNFPDGVKMEDCFPTDKKIFHLSQDIVKSENCLPSEKNNCSFSKSKMAENMIYQEQPNIPKIAVEIKIHISSEENTKICKVLNESLLHPSEKTENTNSKTADVSIKLNGLADNFLIPITNVTDKPEALFHSNSKIDSSHTEISNTFEFNQLKDKDLDGPSDNTSKLPVCELKKRKLETSDCEISTKKLKQEPCNASSIHKPLACDITSLILTEINEALPSHLNKKIRVSKTGLDYLVLQAFQKTFHVNFHQELSEAEKLIKELEEKSRNLSKTSDLLLSSFREFRSIQKESYVSNSYKRISNRTVGINVKIINAKDQETIPTNAVSKKNNIIRKENEVSVIKETKGASSLQQNVSVIKETKGTSFLQQNVVPISSQSVPVEEKKVIELPKTLLPNGPKNAPQMEQKAHPFTPNKFSPPNVIQSGNRLIPYLNPTKRVSAPIVHVTNVLSSSKPVTNVVSSGNPAMKNFLEKTKQSQHNERAPSPIKPDTSIQSSRTPVNNILNSNPIMKSLLDLTEQPRYNESTQKGNSSRTSASPQNQQPKISGSAAVPLNQPLQLCPSARSEAPKVSVVFPFRTTASSVAPTVTINKDSYGIPQNHPVMRNIPSVSEALRNQILKLPHVYSDARISSPVFTKPYTGMTQNRGQYPAGFPRFSQSNLSQGPMASVNSSPFPLYHPTTTASNHMQQSNLQLSSMHHLSNSPYNPLSAMNHLSPSMGHPPLSLPNSVASVNPSPSALTSPAFYPGAPASMNQFAPNQFYPQTSINHFTSSPHSSAQLRPMLVRNLPVTTVANPSAPSSRVTPVFAPPPPMPSKWTPLQPPVQSRLITPPSTPPATQYITSKQQIPPLPETPVYDEPLPKPTLKVTKEETDVILSWNVDLTTTTVTLSSYQIYSCHTSSQISQLEVLPVWKKVGDVAALQLPMACRLRKFEKNKSYHFILRIVDSLQRLGPFSDCASVDI